MPYWIFGFAKLRRSNGLPDPMRSTASSANAFLPCGNAPHRANWPTGAAICRAAAVGRILVSDTTVTLRCRIQESDLRLAANIHFDVSTLHDRESWQELINKDFLDNKNICPYGMDEVLDILKDTFRVLSLEQTPQ